MSCPVLAQYLSVRDSQRAGSGDGAMRLLSRRSERRGFNGVDSHRGKGRVKAFTPPLDGDQVSPTPRRGRECHRWVNEPLY